MSTYNKINIGDNTILDLSATTLTSPSQVLNGITCHLRSGEQKTGTATINYDYTIGGSLADGTLTGFYTPYQICRAGDVLSNCPNLQSVQGTYSRLRWGFKNCPNLTDIYTKNGGEVSWGQTTINDTCKFAVINNEMFWVQYTSGISTLKIYASAVEAGTPELTQIGQFSSSQSSESFTYNGITFTNSRSLAYVCDMTW